MCKSLHTPALRHILYSVEIQREDQLIGFCACILANTSQRAPWIKDLNINESVFRWIPGKNPYSDVEFSPGQVPAVDSAIFSALAIVLEQCRELRILHIACPAQAIAACPQISTSLVSLPHLKELGLTCINDYSVVLHILDRMSSRLHSLRLAEFIYDMREVPQRWPIALHSSTPSIEVLDMSTTPVSWEMMQQFKWQHVHTLNATLCYINFKTVFTTLPNLRYLHICDGSEFSTARTEDSTFWPALDTLTQETYLSLMICSVPRTIRYIGVQFRKCVSAASESEAVDRLFTLLREARPFVLVLDKLDARLGHDFWPEFRAISSNLHCLDLVVVQRSHHDRVELMVRMIIFRFCHDTMLTSIKPP